MENGKLKLENRFPWERREELPETRTALPANDSLEDELQSKLHDAGIMRRCGCQVRGRLELAIDDRELSVVERVERFPTEFKGRGFLDGEALEKSHVEICAEGQVQVVSADVTERESTGRRKGAGVEEKRSRAG